MEYQTIICEATDWWIVGSTIATGLLTAIATILAVVFTNRSNAKRYAQELKNNALRYEQELEKQRKELERQHKEKALVFLKPILRHTRFNAILEDLIIRDIGDRMLLLPRDDEFEYFYNDPKMFYLYRFLFVRNESGNDVRLLKISLASNLYLKDNPSGAINFSKTYHVKFFRSKDTVIIPIYGSLQEEKLRSPHDSEMSYTLEFNCKMDYLTMAEQQVSHEYEGEIPTVIKFDFDDRDKKEGKYSYPEHSEAILKKDDPSPPFDDCTLDKDVDSSNCINLQDRISHIDRLNHIHKKIGEAQSKGMVENIITKSGTMGEIFEFMDSVKEKIVKPIGELIENFSKSETAPNDGANIQADTPLLNDNEEISDK